jgi:hypothetical protein
MCGLVMGSIPVINVPTGIIKFFVYYLQSESEFNDTLNRENLDGVAKSTNQAVQVAFKNRMNDTFACLKWYALLQVIPLVGIYFALAEKELLEKMNSVKASLNEPSTNESDSVSVKNTPKSKVTKIIVTTPEEFKTAIDKDGTVVVCFPGNAFWKSEKYPEKVESLVNESPGPITFVFVDRSKEALKDLIPSKTPATVIRRNRTEIKTIEHRNYDLLEKEIQGN